MYSLGIHRSILFNCCVVTTTDDIPKEVPKPTPGMTSIPFCCFMEVQASRVTFYCISKMTSDHPVENGTVTFENVN